jgi:hypothetical protein
MRRHRWALSLPVGYVFFVACVGDEPTSVDGANSDGGTDGSLVGTDGGGGGDTDGNAPGDGGKLPDAQAPLCGYPGEDCCAAPTLACREGTTCGTSNHKCMVNELAVVGGYIEISGSFVNHTASAFWDGATWTAGPDVITENTLSSFSETSLISGGPQNYFVTIFKSSEGRLLNYYSNAWRKCEPGQACVGPTVPAPAMWGVAKIGNEHWVLATNKIFRCTPGANCVNTVTGLESTTWATGVITGTSTQDIWVSASSRAFHFDGTKWTIHDGIKGRTLVQIHKDDVWVGDKTLQHWDGTKWTDEMTIDGAPAPGYIMAMSGSASDDVWAIGTDGSTGDHPSFTAHWNGMTWTKKALPAGASDVDAIYAPSRLEAYAAGKTGIYKWDGNAWSKVPFTAIDAGEGAAPNWEGIAGPARPRP